MAFRRSPQLCQRFWTRVQVGRARECWPWTGYKTPAGYGHLKTSVRTAGRQGVVSAHRFMWEEMYGPIPTGLFVCHRCDRPSCVNPRHLFLGNAEDNTRDMLAKGRDRMIGARNHESRLTQEQSDEMVAKYSKGGISQPALTKLFRVSLSVVNEVLTGRHWTTRKRRADE